MSVITAPAAPTTRAGTPPTPSRQLKRALRPGTIGKVIVLLVAAFLTLGPVIWTVWTALTPQIAGSSERDFGLSAFLDVFDQVDMVLLIWNSVLVTAACAFGQMLTAALAGYVFARLEFRGTGQPADPRTGDLDRAVIDASPRGVPVHRRLRHPLQPRPQLLPGGVRGGGHVAAHPQLCARHGAHRGGSDGVRRHGRVRVRPLRVPLEEPAVRSHPRDDDGAHAGHDRSRVHAHPWHEPGRHRSPPRWPDTCSPGSSSAPRTCCSR